MRGQRAVPSPREEEEVCVGEIWRKGRVGDQRDGAGSEPILGGGSKKAWGVVPAPNQYEEWS